MAGWYSLWDQHSLTGILSFGFWASPVFTLTLMPRFTSKMNWLEDEGVRGHGLSTTAFEDFLVGTQHINRRYSSQFLTHSLDFFFFFLNTGYHCIFLATLECTNGWSWNSQKSSYLNLPTAGTFEFWFYVRQYILIERDWNQKIFSNQCGDNDNDITIVTQKVIHTFVWYVRHPT